MIGLRVLDFHHPHYSFKEDIKGVGTYLIKKYPSYSFLPMCSSLHIFPDRMIVELKSWTKLEHSETISENVTDSSKIDEIKTSVWDYWTDNMVFDGL